MPSTAAGALPDNIANLDESFRCGIPQFSFQRRRRLCPCGHGYLHLHAYNQKSVLQRDMVEMQRCSAQTAKEREEARRTVSKLESEVGDLRGRVAELDIARTSAAHHLLAAPNSGGGRNYAAVREKCLALEAELTAVRTLSTARRLRTLVECSKPGICAAACQGSILSATQGCQITSAVATAQCRDGGAHRMHLNIPGLVIKWQLQAGTACSAAADCLVLAASIRAPAGETGAGRRQVAAEGGTWQARRGEVCTHL